MTDLRSELAWLVEQFKKHLWCVEHEWGGPIEEYNAEEARAEAILSMTDWQPIDTAPEKGEFLVYNGEEVTFASRDADGLFWTMGYRYGENGQTLRLTRWMPLPDPPKD